MILQFFFFLLSSPPPPHTHRTYLLSARHWSDSSRSPPHPPREGETAPSSPEKPPQA